ncbi:MAG: thiamine phosphate synthase [Acidobacteriota bacterium]
MIKIPPVYPISQPNLEEKKLLRWAKTLLDCGATLIQYRDKNRSDREIFHNAEKLQKLFENYKATLVINDRSDIAFILGLKAVHLGWDDIPPDRARELLGKKVILGISTHSYKVAKIAFSFPVNYLAIGPVFETKTKENPHQVVSPKEQVKIIKECPFPTVAIGGITLDNALELYKRGFSSLSAISVLAENPAGTFKEFLKIHRDSKN